VLGIFQKFFTESSKKWRLRVGRWFWPRVKGMNLAQTQRQPVSGLNVLGLLPIPRLRRTTNAVILRAIRVLDRSAEVVLIIAVAPS
jgi:hypothetical protein